jgi:hypothetical protein
VGLHRESGTALDRASHVVPCLRISGSGDPT